MSQQSVFDLLCKPIQKAIRERGFKEPKRLEVPITKPRKIPLGLIQAYIRAKLEGWLLDEYDLGSFIKKSAQIWQVPVKRVRQWITQIDSALNTRVGLKFIYCYIVAKRKG